MATSSTAPEMTWNLFQAFVPHHWKQTLSFILRFNSNSIKLQAVESWGRLSNSAPYCLLDKNEASGVCDLRGDGSKMKLELGSELESWDWCWVPVQQLRDLCLGPDSPCDSCHCQSPLLLSAVGIFAWLPARKMSSLEQNLLLFFLQDESKVVHLNVAKCVLVFSVI